MEGSNEESDPSSQSHHHTQHSTSHPQSANNGATEPAPPTHTLKSESAGGDNDLNQSTHIIDTSAYHPLGDEQDVANQSVYIDTSNPFDTETVRHILKQLPTPIKLHPSYHEVPRQIQSIICGLKITLGQRKFVSLLNFLIYIHVALLVPYQWNRGDYNGFPFVPLSVLSGFSHLFKWCFDIGSWNLSFGLLLYV